MGCDEVILEKISNPGKDTSSNNPLGSEELLKQALQHPPILVFHSTVHKMDAFESKRMNQPGIDISSRGHGVLGFPYGLWCFKLVLLRTSHRKG